MPEFEIYTVRVGAGQVGICAMPGRSGAYLRDLSMVLNWHPAMVLSMTQPGEFTLAGAASLGGNLRAAGVVWHPIPVADYGTPDHSGARLWPDISVQAARVLAEGGNILIHCFGGCGRSGMVALRLMVEAGEAPDVALRRLRNVRPCAVETPAQHHWAISAV